MGLKISRGLWFVSIMALLAVFLYVYAGLPEDVVVTQSGGEFLYAGRETFFYAGLIVVTLINSMVFLISALFKKDHALRVWFNFLMVILNLFFIISLFLLNAVNSNEKFNFQQIGFVIYGSVILIGVWAISWPIYLLIRKFSGKSSV